MSPDEDESTNVATAEPEAEQEGSLTPPEEPEPGTEQEQPEAEAEPADDSGAGAPEDEGEAEAEPPDLKAQLAEVLKGIPQEDLVAALSPEQQERLRAEPQEAPDSTEVEIRDRGVSRRERTQKYDSNLSAMLRDAWRPADVAWRQHTSELDKQAQALAKGEADKFTADPKDVQQAIAQMQRVTQEAVGAHTNLRDMEHVQEALEVHPAWRYLSAEDKQAISAPLDENTTFADWSKKAIGVVLNAILERGAPEEVKRRSKKEAEDAVGLTERLEKLRAYVGQNGAKGKSVEAGSGAGVAINSFDDAEAAWLDGKISDEQYRKYRDQYKIKTG